MLVFGLFVGGGDVRHGTPGVTLECSRKIYHHPFQQGGLWCRWCGGVSDFGVINNDCSSEVKILLAVVIKVLENIIS